MIYCSRSEELDRLLLCEMDYFVFVVIYDYIHEIPLHQFLLRGFLQILIFSCKQKACIFSLFRIHFYFSFHPSCCNSYVFPALLARFRCFLLSLEINSMIFSLSSTNFYFLYFSLTLPLPLFPCRLFGVMKCFPRVSYRAQKTPRLCRGRMIRQRHP